MSSLHRLTKRCFSSNQVMLKQEISPTITQLDYTIDGVSSNQFSNRQSFRGPLKAAILDWAGTTIDAHVLAPATCFYEAFKGYGVPITMAQAREPMGLRKDIHIQKILQMPEVRQKWIEMKGYEPTKDTVDEVYEIFVPMQLDVLGNYTTLIPGCAEAVETMKAKFGLKIGTTTGFTRAMMDILIEAAAKQGYIPDSCVAGDDVVNGLGFRPSPFMLYQNLFNLGGIFPIESVIKIDDTNSGIAEGLNAGCWTVGVYGWSNYTDIDSMEEWMGMDETQQRQKRMKSRDKLIESGAHYVVESIVDVPNVVQLVNERLRIGESPMSNYMPSTKIN